VRPPLARTASRIDFISLDVNPLKSVDYFLPCEAGNLVSLFPLHSLQPDLAVRMFQLILNQGILELVPGEQAIAGTFKKWL
jgi:hypothetical protein